MSPAPPPAAPPDSELPEPTVPRPPRAAPRFTAVASDFHLADFEAPDPRRPAWRRFKHADVATDARFLAQLDHLRTLADGAPVELILAGDIFDFDTIVARPGDGRFRTTWLERRRGLDSEEAKSVWKMRRILAAHGDLIAGWRRWLADGNTLVFIVGNHDLDLHWPAVQAELRAAVSPPDPDQLVVCEFFRVTGGDTLVMHGNQFDAYCVCQDPVHPFIDVEGRVRVRAPFGNLAGKLMLNGMGFFNPHVESSFIRPLPDYVSFFFRYIVRFQPLLAVSWLWSAVATLWVSLDEGFRPALHDPARLEERVADVARRARSTPAVVRGLRAVGVHSAVFSPLRVARELWLDRAVLLVLVIALVFQAMSTLAWVGVVSPWWGLLAFVALAPLYVGYARSCRSEVGNTEANIRRQVPRVAAIAGVHRVVTGHTHRAGTRVIDGVTYFNTGHWSPAFDDVECTIRVGTNGFVWLRPGEHGREAELRAFDGVGSAPYEGAPEAMAPILVEGSGVAA